MDSVVCQAWEWCLTTKRWSDFNFLAIWWITASSRQYLVLEENSCLRTCHLLGLQNWWVLYASKVVNQSRKQLPSASRNQSDWICGASWVVCVSNKRQVEVHSENYANLDRHLVESAVWKRHSFASNQDLWTKRKLIIRSSRCYLDGRYRTTSNPSYSLTRSRCSICPIAISWATHRLQSSSYNPLISLTL